MIKSSIKDSIPITQEPKNCDPLLGSCRRFSFNQSKFGDIIITIEPEDLSYFRPYYDANQVTVLKTKKEISSNFLDFQYETKHGDYYLYINEKARKICPRIFNDKVTGIPKVTGSSLILILTSNEKKYVVFVKDRNRKIYSLLGGSRIHPNECYVSCAVRECFEESGINLGTCKLTRFSQYNYKTNIYELGFPGYTVVFYAELTVNKNEFERISNFSNEEIDHIRLVPIEEIQFLNRNKYSRFALAKIRLLTRDL